MDENSVMLDIEINNMISSSCIKCPLTPLNVNLLTWVTALNWIPEIAINNYQNTQYNLLLHCYFFCFFFFFEIILEINA